MVTMNLNWHFIGEVNIAKGSPRFFGLFSMVVTSAKLFRNKKRAEENNAYLKKGFSTDSPLTPFTEHDLP
jgi:hypothetical protein